MVYDVGDGSMLLTRLVASSSRSHVQLVYIASYVALRKLIAYQFERLFSE